MNKIVPEAELACPLTSESALGRKICIVTGELEGPFFNGGVGTTNRALALVLRKLGYDVDILYTLIRAKGTTGWPDPIFHCNICCVIDTI
jgi:hypothetical protein